ncbi:hypothetical protein JJE66_29330 [Bradyrhizobium diazoefficiens]|uniref:hypothetical protein n=1 Tax=Bradyrhizobium diazoefficiens TaxID=1355477 RepID=UPI00190CD159|nr:hypothetical protein [Bradyrhizobium diazoefficiens]MBK3665321.1 hypothetical protein [Bradyrhizobium diazoefficiens]
MSKFKRRDGSEYAAVVEVGLDARSSRSKSPDLHRLLRQKRRQFASAYHRPGPVMRDRKTIFWRSMGGMRGWQIGEEWLLISAAVSVVAVLVGFLVSVHYFAGGPPWPTQLVISVQAPPSVSPFESIFLARNQSGLFGISNLSVGCRIISVRTKRLSMSKGSKISLMFPSRGPAALVRPASANPFTCPFREYIESVSGAVALDDPTEAQIMLVAKYDAPWWWPINPEVSALFALDTRSSSPRWTMK